MPQSEKKSSAKKASEEKPAEAAAEMDIDAKVKSHYNLDDPVEKELARLEREIFGQLPQEVIDQIDKERLEARQLFEGQKQVIPTQIKKAVDQLKIYQNNYEKCRYANPQDPEDAKKLQAKGIYESLIQKQHQKIQELLIRWQRIKRNLMD